MRKLTLIINKSLQIINPISSMHTLAIHQKADTQKLSEGFNTKLDLKNTQAEHAATFFNVLITQYAQGMGIFLEHIIQSGLVEDVVGETARFLHQLPTSIKSVWKPFYDDLKVYMATHGNNRSIKDNLIANASEFNSEAYKLFLLTREMNTTQYGERIAYLFQLAIGSVNSELAEAKDSGKAYKDLSESDLKPLMKDEALLTEHISNCMKELNIAERVDVKSLVNVFGPGMKQIINSYVKRSKTSNQEEDIASLRTFVTNTMGSFMDNMSVAGSFDAIQVRTFEEVQKNSSEFVVMTLYNAGLNAFRIVELLGQEPDSSSDDVATEIQSRLISIIFPKIHSDS